MNATYKFFDDRNRLATIVTVPCYRTNEFIKVETKRARIALGDSLAFGGKWAESAQFERFARVEGDREGTWENVRAVLADVPLVSGDTASVLCYQMPGDNSWEVCVSFPGLPLVYAKYPFWLLVKSKAPKDIMNAALGRIRDAYLGK